MAKKAPKPQKIQQLHLLSQKTVGTEAGFMIGHNTYLG